MNIFVLGPAGSGKSLFVKNFSAYLSSEGYKVRIINLDPGVLDPGYRLDFDIRSKFTVESIMREMNLGPNGAILESMERLAKTKVPKFEDADYVLFDTPGQLEPFLFRDAGRIIVSGFYDRCCLFLGDLSALKMNLVSFYLYALTAYYTLETETIAVLNKADLLDEKEIEEVKNILRDPNSLLMRKPANLREEMDIELLKSLRGFFPPKRVPLISAKTGVGFDEILTILHEIKCACGDLT
ncbi:MAG: ATP/GTP-binding protein [Candidatus Bathyarchaeota archaeon]|nr:ATP/GTP-binding protein [Candidatus Bathyarchaeota archaeon]